MDFPYHRVASKFWSDEKTIAWDDDTRLLGLYLLTCEHRTVEGLFRLPKAYICGDLQWLPERLPKPFGQLLADGFVMYDETTSVMFLPNALQYQKPANPNMVKAAVKAVAALPRSALDQHFYATAERLCKPLAERLPERFSEPPSLAPTPSLTPEVITTHAKIEQPKLSKTMSGSDFGEFWSHYPRKRAKADTRKAIDKLVSDGADPNALVEASAHFAETMRHEQRDDSKVPYPATWLRRGEWADYVDGPILETRPSGKPDRFAAYESDVRELALRQRAEERADQKALP